MSAPVCGFPPPKHNVIVDFIPLADKSLDSDWEFLSDLGISRLSLSPIFCPDWASLDSTHCLSLLYVPPEVPKEMKAEILSDTTSSKVVWLLFVYGFLIVDIFVSYPKQKMNTNTSATRISGSDSAISATDYMDKRNQEVITSPNMAFLNAVLNQDIGRAKENDFEAFMAPGSMHTISNSVDVEFNNDYTETNEAEYNDSDNSNDYSYVNINTLAIKSDFVTENVNQESHLPFYEPNTVRGKKDHFF
ncbi:hypothetical protein PHYBLDRAFT_144818 [Phycomyces blakesleeanus NRRL 1555(-)]|uniref:Uncharacterized protein n=1 Tax=Phycomyces blakesleeanus (strain ATCC 8743b / DSM 1359 / FGSC 10004 / NBRC 33097 / NRRL 1555) TaxID=763407 RepID=A0A162NHR6_PHYB8|nr:hypothetical protein PHYBLDRAFT_144818 [Phycomyces blakesleeanus NRRL 1555(-)]OAD74368.1 hypothetical protein PHYBLDRAFT_144818 [Phycomyces blakesleeanus NRRL 1555(-)]|eukprot:XP_018292408.1 hypothetical protein PHYBLDRAFT_144818 [Phycomyces blakesleeanus NRRL 1555(-)]